MLPVGQLQLFDRAEHGLQVALLVLEHQGGQPLQDQRHVEHQDGVARRHMAGLLRGRQGYKTGPIPPPPTPPTPPPPPPPVSDETP